MWPEKVGSGGTTFVVGGGRYFWASDFETSIRKIFEQPSH
jgi:hypothetical protein